MIIVRNEKNKLIPTRIVTRWHMCNDYRRLNQATRKDHLPLPFIDRMLKRTVGQTYYCFLDVYSGYNQTAVELVDKEKPLLHALLECSLITGCHSYYATL